MRDHAWQFIFALSLIALSAIYTWLITSNSVTTTYLGFPIAEHGFSANSGSPGYINSSFMDKQNV
jgi:hypothetical protein